MYNLVNTRREAFITSAVIAGVYGNCIVSTDERNYKRRLCQAFGISVRTYEEMWQKYIADMGTLA